jgi:hypothetical protein
MKEFLEHTINNCRRRYNHGGLQIIGTWVFNYQKEKKEKKEKKNSDHTKQ